MRGDGGVVSGRVGEHTRRQLAAKFQCGLALGFDLRGDFIVIVRVHHHRHVRVIFGGAPQHGRTPDVDGLNRFSQRDLRPGHRLLERIEVHRNQIDRANAVLFHRRLVRRIAAKKKQAAVDFWMQCLHAAVEHFRKTGIIAQFDDRQAGLTQDLGGAAGRNQFHPGRRQRLRERNEPGLVKNRDEGALDLCHKNAPKFRQKL